MTSLVDYIDSTKKKPQEREDLHIMRNSHGIHILAKGNSGRRPWCSQLSRFTMSLRFTYSRSCTTFFFLHNFSTAKLLTIGDLIGTKEITEVLQCGFKFLKNLIFLFFSPQTNYFDPWEIHVSYTFWRNKHTLGHQHTSRIFLVYFYCLLPNCLLTYN